MTRRTNSGQRILRTTTKSNKKLASTRSINEAAPGEGRNDPAVAAFFRTLEHPLKKELALIRKDILAVSPAIQEGIKWNAPSFRTSDWFATFSVHGKGSIRIILHNGAKAKATAQSGLEIKDPSGLLKWLAKDRCLVTFKTAKEVVAKRAALKAIVKSWISQL